MAIFIIGVICFSLTVVFYAAIFPQLARNTPRMREVRKRFDEGEITAEKYKWEEALEKSKISSHSLVRTLLALPSAGGDMGILGVWSCRLRYNTLTELGSHNPSPRQPKSQQLCRFDVSLYDTASYFP
jgi:hypothetical protein